MRYCNSSRADGRTLGINVRYPFPLTEYGAALAGWPRILPSAAIPVPGEVAMARACSRCSWPMAGDPAADLLGRCRSRAGDRRRTPARSGDPRHVQRFPVQRACGRARNQNLAVAASAASRRGCRNSGHCERYSAPRSIRLAPALRPLRSALALLTVALLVARRRAPGWRRGIGWRRNMAWLLTAASLAALTRDRSRKPSLPLPIR